MLRAGQETAKRLSPTYGKQFAKRTPLGASTEIEFKCMLAEEHRLGRLVLATADLKDKRNLLALEASVIAYKNTVWHFLRVEDD